jgi:hypothetical protein
MALNIGYHVVCGSVADLKLTFSDRVYKILGAWGVRDFHMKSMALEVLLLYGHMDR